MGAHQSNHFTISESHALKDTTNVIGRRLKASHGSIGQPILGVGLFDSRSCVVIRTSGAKWNGRTSRFFNSNYSSIGVEISVANVGKFGLDGLENFPGLVQTRIVPVSSFYFRAS